MNISSHFQIHTKLNPTVWYNGKIRPKVLQRLLTIAHDFIEYIGIPVKIKDIVITGSMANYNYTEHSDIDIHIIMQFLKVNQNLDLVSEFLLAKRSLWNDKHEIMIGNHEVEVYPENAGEVHHSTGIYSILHNKWIKQPKGKTPKGVIDMYAINAKVNNLIHRINETLSLSTNNKLVKITNLQEKIKKMRQCGLSKNGEYSVENLTFKVLRNTGYIKKLWDGAREEKDRILSLDDV